MRRDDVGWINMTYTQMTPDDIPKFRVCDASECWMPGATAFAVGALLIVFGIADRLTEMLTLF
ncbi:MAG: hypothetical protein ACR2N7_07740 [Acidimicrobiia bacterium]